jgi:hypothetical protein
LIPAGNQPSSIFVYYTITTDKGKETQTIVHNKAEFKLNGEGLQTFAYEAGKAYKYIFKITLQSIEFDVQETPWDTTTPDKDITPVDPSKNQNQGN